jgi:hypothetical protein
MRRDDPFRVFGVLGAFAMNCAKPADAFVEAVRVFGIEARLWEYQRLIRGQSRRSVRVLFCFDAH